MKIGIISDIHSNIQALSTAFDYAESQGVERMVCLGDVVGYGADPNPCCDLIRDRCGFSLLGNHDAAVIGAMEESYYYQEAKDVILWTRDRLTDENFSWLFSLPYTAKIGDFGFFHSAPILPSGFYYMVHEGDAAYHLQIFDKLDRYSFIGHSHLTQTFILSEGEVRDVTGTTETPGDGEKIIMTVGSVGQPRDRNPDLCFVIVDTESGEYKYVRLGYDIKSAAEQIEAAGLSQRFSRRLYEGI